MFQLAPPDDDGLFIPEVGPWSANKHHFLRRYIDAFMVAMRQKRWHGLHYVDLFAGAGIERIKGDGLDWGSPLIAAQAPHRFNQLHLCEKNLKAIEALDQRISRFPQPKAPQVLRGDANTLISEIIREIPAGCLTLVSRPLWATSPLSNT
jgi:three-Cys-motif partner protein